MNPPRIASHHQWHHHHLLHTPHINTTTKMMIIGILLIFGLGITAVSPHKDISSHVASPDGYNGNNNISGDGGSSQRPTTPLGSGLGIISYPWRRPPHIHIRTVPATLSLAITLSSPVVSLHTDSSMHMFDACSNNSNNGSSGGNISGGCSSSALVAAHCPPSSYLQRQPTPPHTHKLPLLPIPLLANVHILLPVTLHTDTAMHMLRVGNSSGNKITSDGIRS